MKTIRPAYILLILSKIFTSNWTLGFMFASGLLIAGSDGEWFPWINFIGIAIFVLVCVLPHIFVIPAEAGIQISIHHLTSLRPAPWRK